MSFQAFKVYLSERRLATVNTIANCRGLATASQNAGLGLNLVVMMVALLLVPRNQTNPTKYFAKPSQHLEE